MNGRNEPSARSRCSAVRLRLACACLVAGLTGVAHAQVEGDWQLTLTEPGGNHIGLLTIERTGSGLSAFVDGGPVPIEIDGDEIEMTLDYRDGGGRYLERYLSGRIEGAHIAGTIRFSLGTSEGTWRAERSKARNSAAPAAVDLSGIWSRTSSGTAKINLDYTPAAQAIVDSYSYLDDPALRCISPGLMRVSGWPYPLEIVQTDDQITILYESFHEVRRIWLDGRGYPDDAPNRAMGYSLGRWDGSVLVVETEKLAGGYVDLAGQPISKNARIVERIWIEDEGQTLKSELTLYDPDNYRRPIPRTRSWRRTPETVILEYDCDPYPFFRGLELEGKLDEYWQRMRQRR